MYPYCKSWAWLRFLELLYRTNPKLYMQIRGPIIITEPLDTYPEWVQDMVAKAKSNKENEKENEPWSN